mmetsp:Transcript_15324/g.19715  ORF Transcript_15324/g.19715 Transcript_15324/m.19715 type:complete len:151 (-) Transcript_15324:1366-1818(-)
MLKRYLVFLSEHHIIDTRIQYFDAYTKERAKCKSRECYINNLRWRKRMGSLDTKPKFVSQNQLNISSNPYGELHNIIFGFYKQVMDLVDKLEHISTPTDFFIIWETPGYAIPWYVVFYKQYAGSPISTLSRPLSAQRFKKQSEWLYIPTR